MEPNPGLVHYVDSSWLICRWNDHRTFLREEENAERLRTHNEKQGYRGDNSPVASALNEVFESTGDEVSFYRGILSGSPAAIDRVRVRAHVEQGKNSPVAYVDRRGELQLPFDEALELARRFCAAEPAPVLAKAESVEQEWAEEARHPGGEYVIELLNEYRAAWALVRQWAGLDAAVAEREAQIQKLERLVLDAIYVLQKAHLDDEAAKLRRAIEKR